MIDFTLELKNGFNMKAPLFWNKEHSLWGLFFIPFGMLFAFGNFLRQKKKSFEIPVPVFCIGNIVVGGSGKTPTALYLADIFSQKAKKVVYLNHGYKSERQNVVLQKGSVFQQGLSEEAFLLAQKAETVINSNRKEGALTALKLSPDILIMDDGFQNPSLQKDFSILVFDGHKGIGNGRILPAGPLRESLKSGLKRAQAVLILGEDETSLSLKIQKINPKMPVFLGQIRPSFPFKKKEEYIAFAGIGRPSKFFDMLKENGFNLKKEISFSDHCPYTSKEIKFLKSLGKNFITTEKDYIKLPKDFQKQVDVVPISILFQEERRFENLVLKEIKK
ncbi:MAG: tetraacyldisaccharide 4'-kinase [Alphaproteobacteria bacterium]|nr:tetraacyldisaccharide 4'-kinase [Alphaproteobacteria bacterium]